jgi:hypothetical protein
MKRLVLFLMCALISICTSAAVAQGWSPGPMGAPPPVMCPAPGCDVGVQPLFPGPPMGPMPMCKPPLGPASFSVFVGWQPNSDPGLVKLTTEGIDLFNKMGTSLNLNYDGLWVGVSGRLPVSRCFSLRGEFRNLFTGSNSSNNNQTVNTTTQLAVGTPGSRTFSAQYVFRVLDGSIAMQLSPCLSVLSGIRWDFFDIHMSNPPNISRFSTNGDEGDLTLSSVIPYLGFESAWTSCNSGLMLRAVGTPWIAGYTNFGLTFGDPGGLPTIRDALTQQSSKYGTWYELSANYGRKFCNAATVGAFVSVQGISAHTETQLTSMRAAPASLNIAQTFDVDMNRRSWIFGGSASVAFGSPF